MLLWDLSSLTRCIVRIKAIDGDKVGADASSGMLAAATPAYFVSVDNDTALDPNVVYPAALAKQMAKTEIKFDSTDIFVFLNYHLEHAMWSKVGVCSFVCTN
jgi:hypothetical protein